MSVVIEKAMEPKLRTTSAKLAAQYYSVLGRKVFFLVIALFLVGLSVALDITSGPSNLTISELLSVLWSPEDHETGLQVIVWDLRLPIALLALLVGAMLGMAGAEMQTILNNPLADPFTLGISSAASFGASVAIVFQWGGVPGYGGLIISTNAFMMALSTSVVLFAFTRMRGVTSETMILVGIALMFTYNALLALMQYNASELQLAQIIFWMMGSLARASWNKVFICVAIIAVILPWFMSRNWSLTALRMGDDKAASLGVNVKRLRIEMLIGVSLLAATAVSFVGTIAFVGLVGPHIARMIVGEDQRYFLPLSAISSGLILSLTSIVSKMINPGVVYPIGIITSLIGVPFFLSLVIAIRRKSWQ
ncbi:MAG: iron ABC transporter permease [Hyphomicrobiales bacterium]